MVRAFITFALKIRLVVLLVAAGWFVWSIYSIKENPIDVIPDLSMQQYRFILS